MKDTIKGVLFATLWASATIASKYAVKSADLFLFTCMRFVTVAIILQAYTTLTRSSAGVKPTAKELKQLLLVGFLNITVYMCGFLIAVKSVSAGLISLVTSTNPLVLILLSALILKKKVSAKEWLGILIAISGLVVAAIPNLENNTADFKGIGGLVGAIISFSFGSIYFSKIKPRLSNLTVNTWQITFGGLLLIPVVLLNYSHNFLIPDVNFYVSFAWLVLPVSLLAYWFWLVLLQKDPVKAGKWLFLTPVLGYAMSVVILKEPLTMYGISGTLMVLAGLVVSAKKTVA